MPTRRRPSTVAAGENAGGVEQVQEGAGGQESRLRVGEGPNAEAVDLSTPLGLFMALELALDSAEIMDAYARMSQQIAGRNPLLQALEFQRMVPGGRLGLVESQRFRRRTGTFQGGLLGLNAPAAGVTGLAEREIEERLQARRVADRRGRQREAGPVRPEHFFLVSQPAHPAHSS